jgi:DNA-binding beta-propeller fold protein YncE
LFKDKDPWEGMGPARALTSLAAPGPVVDESQLDAAGNLPEGASEAPAAPLAPEALGDVVNSFLAPPGTMMVGLEWIDGYLWASGWDSVLYKLNPANGAILETIPVPGVFPCGLAWDGSAFWISDCGVHRLVQVDLTGAVLRSFPSPGPDTVGVAWDGTALWDVDWMTDELHRIDPFTGAVLHTIPAPDTRAAGVAWDGRYLWTNGRDSAMTYKLEPDTGAVLASFGTPPGPILNNGQGVAFDGMYLWVANYDNGTIYQIDVEHVAPQLEPNEQVLRRWGIPYDIFGSADMGAVNLQPYCKVVVVSDQPNAFYQTLSDQRAWFEAWIEQGNIFELNGASFTESWPGLPMPGGFTSVVATSDDVTIRDTLHPILRLPNTISGAELDGWNSSTHGYLVDLPPKADNIIAQEPSGEPATTEFHLERGCVLATKQPLEWAWMFRYSPLLENMVLDRRCQPFLIYLPLVVKNAP